MPFNYVFYFIIQMSLNGLDLRFALQSSMSRELERRVVTARDQMLDAIKLRAQDDSWEPTRFADSRRLNEFLEEMNDIGVAGLGDYVTGEGVVIRVMSQ